MGCIKMILSNICCALKYPGGILNLLHLVFAYLHTIGDFKIGTPI